MVLNPSENLIWCFFNLCMSMCLSLVLLESAITGEPPLEGNLLNEMLLILVLDKLASDGFLKSSSHIDLSLFSAWCLIMPNTQVAWVSFKSLSLRHNFFIFSLCFRPSINSLMFSSTLRLQAVKISVLKDVFLLRDLAMQAQLLSASFWSTRWKVCKQVVFNKSWPMC